MIDNGYINHKLENPVKQNFVKKNRREENAHIFVT